VLANIFGADSLYVLIIAVVVLFGGSQLPKLARNAGEAMKEFRKAHAEAATPLTTTTPTPTGTPVSSTVTPTPAPLVPPPTALPSSGQAQSAVGTPARADDQVVLTRSELDALLADREARARSTQSGN
jgi:sec-independent protein translocase protein TatA